MPRWTAVGILLGTLGTAPAAAQIETPDPVQSTFDDLVGVGPRNSTAPAGCRYSFNGILRNANGNPIPRFPAHQMNLDFRDCTRPSTRPADLIPADMDTDSEGRVRWEINLTFGGADPCPVRVLIQNVVFKQLEPHRGLPGPEIDGGVRSPDEDHVAATPGITLTDFVIFKAEFNNTNANARLDWRGDLAPPFDGLTTLTDLVWFTCQFSAH